jgi:hypothetical protein
VLHVLLQTSRRNGSSEHFHGDGKGCEDGILLPEENFVRRSRCSLLSHVIYGLGGSQLVGSGNRIPLGALYVGKKIKARLGSVSS